MFIQKMHKAHQIQLNPTHRQKQLFTQACGCKRKSYNWALVEWDKWFRDGKKPSAMSLVKHLNSIKKTEFPYFQDVSKSATQYAIWDLADAWKRYFDRLKDGRIAKGKTAFIKKHGVIGNEEKLKNFGKPNFKKKGKSIDSFVAVEGCRSFKQADYKIHIPRIGKVKCSENLRFSGKVNSVIVKRIADKWFAVIQIETPNEAPLTYEKQVVIGVDLGIKTLATCSDGQVFENPKALKSNLKSLKRSQRSLSRKVKGSNNRKKQQMAVAKKYYRVSCIRNNALHQATSKIVNSGNVIVIEDLNVKGMIKNKNLSRVISDVGFGEFRRQIEYKALWQNKTVIIADRFFASSKTCSCCGLKKEILKLNERTFCCFGCGLTIDRDFNAALNLAKYSPTPKVGESEACGESLVAAQRTSMKHEIFLTI